MVGVFTLPSQHGRDKFIFSEKKTLNESKMRIKTNGVRVKSSY